MNEDFNVEVKINELVLFFLIFSRKINIILLQYHN